MKTENGDEQLMVRAAWLYHMEGLTQEQIARRLALTRVRVNRLLQEARSAGVVSVSINSRLSGCVALEESLRREGGLRDAIVIPTPEDESQLPALLGRAAGDYVSRHLETNRVRGIGIGWGATLRETIGCVRRGSWPSLNVNSIMGGLTKGLEINTFETARRLASRLEADCTYLAAPIYASSKASRDTIVAQDVFRESLAQMNANDLALLSVGDLSTKSLLVRYGLPKGITAASLRKAGAVGDIIGHFLDAQGRPVAHEINDRVIATSLDKLAKIPTVVVASGGQNKAPILAAVLRARLVDVLVCDEATSTTVLRLLKT